MRTNYSAIALALFTASATAQDCPTGYQRAKVSWYTCPVDKIPNLQCTTLEVPLDYSQPTGKALHLRLVRIPALSPNAQTKSIIYNPGGPGDVGIGALVDDGYGLDIQKIVGTEFNLIGFDPRGTGLSIPFECEALKGPKEWKNTDGDLKNLYDALKAQADECAKKDLKINNELMGTAYVARDVKAISEAIGEDNLIRYLGYSYGTLLGATTAAMFPDSIGRMMLDGNINFQDYYYGLGNEAVADVDKAVARFFDFCSEAGPSNCAVAVGNQTGAQLKQRYDNFLSNLTYAESFAIRGGFFSTLYDPARFKNQAVWLGRYYDGTAQIPKRSLHRRADEEDEDEADDGTWNPTQSSDVTTDMTLAAVTCGDWVANPEGSVETFKDWRDIWRATSKYGGDLALLSTLYQCSLWKTDAKEKYTGPFANIKTKNPILFINTPYDPVTPMDSAKNSSASFANSRLLVSTGGGHCSNKQPSKDLDAAIKKYFQDASFPAVTTYNPDKPNAFISAPANTTKTTTKKNKRKISHAHLFKADPIVVRRQTLIPVGCVKSNSTTGGSNSTNSTGQGYGQNGGYSGGSSQSAGYDSYSGSTRSAINGDYSGSTRTAGYGDYSGSSRSVAYGDYSSFTRSAAYGDSQNNYYDSSRPTQSAGSNAYGGYDSSPSSKRPTTMTSAPTSVPTVPCTTSTITDITYETITKCSNDYTCQLGSVVTKTNVRTTVITLTASVPVVSGTPLSKASGTPGQGYNTPPKSANVDGSKPSGSPQSAAFNPGYASPAKASSNGVVNDAAKSTPTAAVSQGSYGGVPSRPSSVGAGSNGTAAVGTPTRNYPAQFTGGAVSQYGIRGFIPAVIAFGAACLAL